MVGAGEHQQALDEALQPFGLLAGGLDVAAGRVRVGVDVDRGTFELQPQRSERRAQLVRSIAGKRALTFDQRGDLLGHRVERRGQAADLGRTLVDRGAAVEVAGGDLLGRSLAGGAAVERWSTAINVAANAVAISEIRPTTRMPRTLLDTRSSIVDAE